MDVAIDKVAAKAARSHEGTPSARDPASLEAEFSAFNKKRAEEKLLLYGTSVSFPSACEFCSSDF